jgi:hypothetical protein
MEDGRLTRAELRRIRRRQAEDLASDQGGVVSRRALYAAGITRAELRANLAARRWQRIGSQSV